MVHIGFWGNLVAVPTQIHGLVDVQSAYSGQLIMKDDHSVWFWDKDLYSSKVNVYPVIGLHDIVTVHSDMNKVLIVDNEGKVSVMLKSNGVLAVSQLEHITSLDIDNVVDISYYYETIDQKFTEQRWIFLKRDGSVWRDAGSLNYFEEIKALDHITAIEKNMALTEEGNVWIIPDQLMGNQFLDPALLEGVVDIRSFTTNSMSNLAIDHQAHLWFWGLTITGVSDGVTLHEHATPVQLRGINHVKEAYLVERSVVVLTTDGNVYETTMDREEMSEDAIFHLLATNISEVKAGQRHMIMEDHEGTLWGWGVNKHAELGHGDYQFAYGIPVRVQKPVVVLLNGESVALTNGVIIRRDQSFVPIRSVFERLGAAVTWDAQTKQVTIKQTQTGKDEVVIRIDYISGEAYLDNKAVTLLQRPFIVNNTAYLPLRFISEALGATVDWAQKEGKISILM